MESLINNNIIPSIEVFIPICNYPNYSISNAGNIKNLKTNRILKPGVNNGYLCVSLCKKDCKPKNHLIHRLIAQHFIPNENELDCVDHINSNRLDNRIVNLRWCSHQQNMHNQSKTTKKTSSKYKGVCWDKQNGKWTVNIKKDNVQQHIGRFDNERDAAIAYNEKAIELFGNFAKLNVISDDE